MDRSQIKDKCDGKWIDGDNAVRGRVSTSSIGGTVGFRS